MNRLRRNSTKAALLCALTALSALLIAGVAAAYKPVVVKSGNLVLTFNGGFSPSKLPRSKPAPINLTVQGKIDTADGGHPPALKEFVLDTDRNGGINTKGIPICKEGQLEAQTSSAAKKACASALLGTGTTGVEVLFPEQSPIAIKSELLLFNGGTKGGKTTLFIHAYLTSPIAAAIVTTVVVSKQHKGRYGTKAVATIPKIAGGSGSVTDFSLLVKGRYTYGGKKLSYLYAKCPDGHLDAQGEAIFDDGSRAKGSISRACTPKG